jgi:cytochrome c peroxidase
MPGNAHDTGRAHITNNASDRYKFKVPSLRDVALSAPYMHDGRFATLDAVLEHYRTGIYITPTLDPILANGISMTDDEKGDIINFLKTLTDTTFIKDKRFAEPKQ